MPSLKRKHIATTSDNGADSRSRASQTSRDTVDDIFRRHFEAKFGTIDLKPVKLSDEKPSNSSQVERDISDSHDGGSEDDWEGLGSKGKCIKLSSHLGSYYRNLTTM